MTVEDERRQYIHKSNLNSVTGALANLNTGPATMVNYDSEDREDGADYYNRINMIKLAWDPDVLFWFNSIEASMRQAQVFKQWTKREVIQNLLPAHVRDEVRYLLRIPQDQAGDLPYKTLKDAIIEIFAPKQQDGLDRALKRVLTTRPSALGKQLIDDVCTCIPTLNCKCCANIIFGLFRRQLPTAVRNAIADKTFNKDTYKDVLSLADKVFESNKPDAFGATTVAAVNPPPPTPLQPGAEGDQGQVAAINRGRGGRGGRGRGRGNRGNSGQNGGRGGSNANSNSNSNSTATASGNKGARHPDVPPNITVCQIHHSGGKNATFCRRPLTCAWKDKIAAE